MAKMARDALLEADLAEKVDGAGAAPTEGADDERTDGAAELSKLALDNVNHIVLILVRLESAEPAAILLSANGEAAGSGSRKAGVEAKGSHAPAILILKELEVVKGTAAVAETLENSGPASLMLVAVCKLNVRLRQGLLRLGKLFEADNGRRFGAVGVPRIVSDELAADARRCGGASREGGTYDQLKVMHGQAVLLPALKRSRGRSGRAGGRQRRTPQTQHRQRCAGGHARR